MTQRTLNGCMGLSSAATQAFGVVISVSPQMSTNELLDQERPPRTVECVLGIPHSLLRASEFTEAVAAALRKGILNPKPSTPNPQTLKPKP